MADSEALQVTLQVTSVFDDLEISYVIGGSMASIIHGMLRTTMDVDIVADLLPEQVAPFVAQLKDTFYIDEAVVHQAIQRRSSFNLIHLTTMFKVDIFLPKDRAFDRQQIARRIAEPIGPDEDAQIWVLTPEDVVLAKLDWFRLGGEVSERQWRDILGVLKTQQTTIDIAYLNHWAQNLGVADLMERALAELTNN